MTQRKLIIVLGLLLAVIVISVVLYVFHAASAAPGSRPTISGQEHPDWAPGTAPPAAAVDTVRRLASTDPNERRSALAPEFLAGVKDTTALPAGATLVLDPQGWRGDDAYAAATATLTLPDQSRQQVVLGFEKVADAWLVTFEESM